MPLQWNDSIPVPSPGVRPKILIVDDEPVIRKILWRWLSSEGYECQVASDGLAAWNLLQSEDFALLISDIMMPGLSGMELLTRINDSSLNLAIIMVTGVDDRKTAIQALRLGAFGYIIKPFDQNEVVINVVNALERQRLLCARNAYEHELEAKVIERTADIRRREEEIVLRLVAASEYRDEETGAHIRRMAMYTDALATALGWPHEMVETLRLAAPMHDIGKIGIPDHILLKPGKLTENEFDVMKRHTVIGAGILGNSDISLLEMARDVALYHHEWWDGSGYPQGLEGDEIPECARIVTLVDVYDALMTNRVYRSAFPEVEAISIMTSGKGTQFDPRIFDCVVKILPAFCRIRQEVAEETVNNVADLPPAMQTAVFH